MDWSDEHYVKLYTRRTPTRQLWPWQARALHPNLLLVLDKSGVLDVGTRDPVRSVAVMVDLPADVVKPGLDAMLEDGTLELNEGRLVMPKFIDAQEARKTRALIARDHREKQRDIARRKRSKTLEHTVTSRDLALPRVTASDPPSPARPLPVPDPEILAGADAPPKRAKPPKPEKPPDPRHQPLIEALTATFEAKRGAKYPFDGGREAREVTLLLASGLDPPAIVAAWERALEAQFPPCATLAKFRMRLPEFVGAGPPSKPSRLQPPAPAIPVGDLQL